MSTTNKNIVIYTSEANSEDCQKFTEFEEDFSNKFKFPLNSTDDIKRFDDELLKNEKYKVYLWRQYTNQFGTDGKKDGNKIGKKLVNALFTLSILTFYSWTGNVFLIVFFDDICIKLPNFCRHNAGR